jgi:hypothetical protein
MVTGKLLPARAKLPVQRQARNCSASQVPLYV